AKTALYRVLQESLTNIAKHAEARNVSVELVVSQTDLFLVIKDDGNGLPTKLKHSLTSSSSLALQNSGLGIRNMIERVESHGGRLTLRSAKSHAEDKGTEVYVTVPLTQPYSVEVKTAA
ncbi:MAG: ATP-binding protein, partial [Hyphomicrobiales bacterium]